MHDNGSFDMLIVVILGSLVVFRNKVSEKFVKHHFNHCASRLFGADIHILPLLIIFALNRVFEVLHVICDESPNQFELLLVILRHGGTQVSDSLFALLHFFLDFCQNGGQKRPQVIEKDLTQICSQGPSAQVFWIHRRVHRMSGKKLSFVFQTVLHSHIVLNVLLASVSDSNEPKSQRNILPFNHSSSVGSFVHDVYFCDNTDGSLAVRVDFSGQT